MLVSDVVFEVVLKRLIYKESDKEMEKEQELVVDKERVMEVFKERDKEMRMQEKDIVGEIEMVVMVCMKERKNVILQPLHLRFIDRSANGIGLHHANGAQRKRYALLEHSALEEIQFQASAAQVEDQARLQLVSQHPMNGRTNQARLFFTADHIEFEAGFSADSLREPLRIAGLARSGGGDGAIRGDVIAVHALSEVSESFCGAGDRRIVEHAAGENIVAQAYGHALVFKNLNLTRGSGARDHQSDGVRSGVNRS